MPYVSKLIHTEILWGAPLVKTRLNPRRAEIGTGIGTKRVHKMERLLLKEILSFEEAPTHIRATVHYEVNHSDRYSILRVERGCTPTHIAGKFFVQHSNLNRTICNDLRISQNATDKIGVMTVLCDGGSGVFAKSWNQVCR